MSDYKKESQILSVLQFFQHNPGTVVSVAYVLLTFCGIVYSTAFYLEFDIAILKIAEVTDLLVSGISEPAALLMFLGGVLLTGVIDLMNIHFFDIQQRWRAKPPSIKRFLVLMTVYVPQKRISVMLFVLCMFILYSGLFVAMYAHWKSEQILKGEGDKISVSVNGENTERHVTLLGSTARYLIVFDQKSEKATLINVEQVETIQPLIGKTSVEVAEQGEK